MPDSLIDAWKKVVFEAISSPGLMVGPRKLVRGLRAEFTPGIESIDLRRLGYTIAKLAQLKRVYWNPDLPMYLKRYAQVKVGNSIAVPMTCGTKQRTSKGHCMQVFILTKYPKHTEVDLFYRSTELCQKFLADLVFLNEQFGQLDLPIGTITLHISHGYVHTLYGPIFLDLLGKNFLLHCRKHDPRLYNLFVHGCKKYFDDPVYTYRTRQKMQKRFWQLPEDLIDYLRGLK